MVEIVVFDSVLILWDCLPDSPPIHSNCRNQKTKKSAEEHGN